MVTHTTNRKGNAPVRLLFFDLKGNFITKIHNTDFWEGINRKTLKTGATNELNVNFYHNTKQQLFFREERGDTIFKITPDMKLRSHIIFSFHDGNTYVVRRSGDTKNYIWHLIKEIDDFLIFYFKYSYWGLSHNIYDIKKQKGFHVKDGGLSDSRNNSEHGFIDDLTDGTNIIDSRTFYHDIAINNCLVDCKSVSELLYQLTPGHLSQRPYKDKPTHQKLIQMLDTLKEDDNPVVIITYLKKITLLKSISSKGG